MQNSLPPFTENESALDATQLERYAEGWLMSGDIDQHSERILGNRHDPFKKLFATKAAQNAARMNCGSSSPTSRTLPKSQADVGAIPG